MNFRNIKEFILISLGVLSASIGLKGFLLPNNFIDGGAMGIALLTHIFTNFELSIIIIVVNIPLILIGQKITSKNFIIKSVLAIIVLSFLVYYIEIPVITQDKLLIAVFGGFFLGLGTGLAIRGGAVIDGSENLAIIVSRKYNLTLGDFITIFNVILFSISALYLNVETAMYSILIYFSASKTADFVLIGIEEYVGITIISDKSEEIRLNLTENLGRAITVYESVSKFNTYKKREVLFCIVTRIEVSKVLFEIEKIDERAFIFQQIIKDVKGGIIKKRPF